MASPLQLVSAEPVKPRSRVLVVDDEKIVSTTLSYIFNSNGYETRQANSGEAALELLADWQPNIAILDVNLPSQLNGVQLAERLLGIHPNCRVLLFSGRPETSEIIEQEATKTGRTVDLVAKPVHPKLLLDWAEGKLTPAEKPTYP